MVFKITRVGSIPAILGPLYLNSKFKNRRNKILYATLPNLNKIFSQLSRSNEIFVNQIWTDSNSNSNISAASRKPNSFSKEQSAPILQHNWIISLTAGGVVQDTTQDKFSNLKRITGKKLISSLDILIKNKNIIKNKLCLNLTENNVGSLSYLLLNGLNNFCKKNNVSFQTPKNRLLSHFKFFNIVDFHNSIKYPRTGLTNFKHARYVQNFYKNNLLTKKSGYLRCFSKTNKVRAFVSFKKLNKLFYFSRNSSNIEHYSLTSYNSFYTYVLFNDATCNFNNSWLNIVFPKQTGCNKLMYDHLSSTNDGTSFFIQNPEAPTFDNINTNVYGRAYLSNYHTHYYNPLCANYGFAKLDKKKVHNTLPLWSGYYNNLFLSRTDNISAKSLFMSISFSDQDQFLKMGTFFADIKFSNFYLNYFPTLVNINKYSQSNLLSLTVKHGSAFLNFLRWRKFTTRSDIHKRVSLLIDSYENDFKTLCDETIYDKFSDLKYIFCNLPYFNNSTTQQLNNFPAHNIDNQLARHLSELSVSFKKSGSFITLSTDEDFQSIPKVRHLQIFKEFAYLGDVEHSIHDTYLRNIEHEESFYPNNYKPNYTNTFAKVFFTHSNNSHNSINITNSIRGALNFIVNPLDLKLLLKSCNLQKHSNHTTKHLSTIMCTFFIKILTRINNKLCTNYFCNNLVPNPHFNFSIFKKVSGSHAEGVFTMSSVPWHYNSIIRFMEFCSGKKVLFQFYPFLFQSVEKYYVVTYKRWMTRMTYYERKLGHRFFLEEALHLIHLTLNLHDPKIMCTWLKAIILRISFWKTRSIFRFLKYLFSQYFHLILNDIGSKGLKICLRGKISAAGNSRTRTILYRTGQTSHANTSLKVLNEFMTIGTFTGVMGFQIWIFY